MEEQKLNEEQKQALRKTDVSGSLPCGCLKCYPNVFPNLRFNVCPICGNKTRTKIRPDTILENFPLFCPKCKQETLISAKDLNVAVIPQQIAESAGAVNGQDERRINAPPLTALPVSADG